MAILYLDGKRLKRAIHASTKWFLANQEVLNKLNVFPVPDGDTGTNMALTLKSIMESFMDHEGEDLLSHIASNISNAALKGARGNSGVILSQIFKGFSEGIGEKSRLNALDVAYSLKKAYERAYNSISDPKEGTILTVVRESANAAYEKAKVEPDIIIMIETLLTQANKSLKNTPNLLPVLKEAGVVDAGAMGFVFIIEGIYMLLKGEALPEIDTAIVRGCPQRGQPLKKGVCHHGYCSEFIIHEKNLDTDEIKTNLLTLGESLIIGEGDGMLKIHIHSPHPKKIIDKCTKYGTLTDIKIEDMDKQHAQMEKINIEKKSGTIQILTDSTGDLDLDTLKKYNIHMIPLNIHFGDTSYKDRIDITPDSFYKLLKIEKIHPKTSQPSPQDFITIYKELIKDGSSVISIHMSSKMSGTVGSATIAKNELRSNKIHIIDSELVSFPLGLLAIEAAIARNNGNNVSCIIEIIEKLKKEMQVYFIPDTLEYLEKGGRIGKASSIIGELLNIKPILTIKEGQVSPFEKIRGDKKIFNRLKNLFSDFLNKNNPENIKLCFAHASSYKKIQQLTPQINDLYNCSNALITEFGPVVGAHIGPGAFGICFYSQTN